MWYQRLVLRICYVNVDRRPVFGLPGQELGLFKHVHCNPKQGRVVKPTNATTRIIVDKILSSLICHSTCFLIGKHTNLMGEQYIREHWLIKKSLGTLRCLKLFSISGFDTVRLWWNVNNYEIKITLPKIVNTKLTFCVKAASLIMFVTPQLIPKHLPQQFEPWQRSQCHKPKKTRTKLYIIVPI